MSCWEHVVRMNRRENTWKGNKADRQILVVVDKNAWLKDAARAMNSYLKEKKYDVSYDCRNAGDSWTFGIGDRDFVLTFNNTSARNKAYAALLDKIDYEGGDCEVDTVDDLGGSSDSDGSGTDTGSGNNSSSGSGLSTSTLLIAGGALLAVVIVVILVTK